MHTYTGAATLDAGTPVRELAGLAGAGGLLLEDVQAALRGDVAARARGPHVPAPHTYQRPRAAVHGLRTRESCLCREGPHPSGWGHCQCGGGVPAGTAGGGWDYLPAVEPGYPPGLAGAEPAQEERIKGEIAELMEDAASSAESRFGQLMRLLSDTQADFYEASRRWGFVAEDNPDAEVRWNAAARRTDALIWRDRVKTVYDGLAEIYREWPEMGMVGFLSGPRGGLGTPAHIAAIIAAIAGVIVAGAIWQWADAAQTRAEAEVQRAQTALTVCEAAPGSPGCEAALKASEPKEGGDGWGGIVMAVGALIALGLLGSAALKRR